MDQATHVEVGIAGQRRRQGAGNFAELHGEGTIIFPAHIRQSPDRPAAADASRSRVLRLVEPKRAATGKREGGQQAPALVLNRPDLDALRLELLDGFLDVV